MFKMEKQNQTAIFKGKQIVFFGWDKLDYARNMAIDEVLLNRAYEEDRFFVRFYDFQRPTVILAADGHSGVVKNRDDGFDVGRRISGGWPIYIDSNVLSYSITGSLKGEPEEKVGTRLHDSLGRLLSESIKDMIDQRHKITLGDISGIRVDKIPIAGHSYHMALNRSFLYHGAVLIDRWKVGSVKRALMIREEEVERIESLPNLSDLSINKKGVLELKDEVIRRIVGRLPKENLTFINDQEKQDIMMGAEKLANSDYRDRKFILGDEKRLLRDDDMKFCLLHMDGVDKL